MVGKLLTLRETAAALRCGVRKVEDLRKSGALAAIKLGTRTVRIREADVLDLLDRFAERGGAEVAHVATALKERSA